MLSLIFIQVDFSVVGLGTMQDYCIKVKIKIKMQKIINQLRISFIFLIRTAFISKNGKTSLFLYLKTNEKKILM